MVEEVVQRLVPFRSVSVQRVSEICVYVIRVLPILKSHSFRIFQRMPDDVWRE
jgi:hypothetical protein